MRSTITLRRLKFALTTTAFLSCAAGAYALPQAATDPASKTAAIPEAKPLPSAEELVDTLEVNEAQAQALLQYASGENPILGTLLTSVRAESVGGTSSASRQGGRSGRSRGRNTSTQDANVIDPLTDGIIFEKPARIGLGHCYCSPSFRSGL